MAVKWKRIGQRKFDRIVEALVHRAYDATARVEAVNGRGGDGGIDIKVAHGSKVRIFQLKYYPDGFPTSAHKGRRKSIEQSFARAMEHQPWEWILVVPCTLTPPEREFVTSLAAGHKVRIRVWDRPKLDGLLATHADLEAAFTRKHLFEAAKVYGQERALLMDGARDVSARVAALGRQIDGLDAHWALDFARQGDMVVQTLRAKHPQAHEVSPVEITLTGNGPLAPDLAETVRRSLGFGLPDEVVLPHEAVESLTVSGPEWLSGEHRDVAVRWQPAGQVPLAETAVEMVFLDAGQVVASYPGTLAHVGRGSVGRSLTVDMTGGSMELMTPEASGILASLRFTIGLEKLEPSTALRLLGIRQRIMDGGAFEVRTGAGTIGGGTLSPNSEAARHEVAELRSYVEDLEVVQRHCEQHFPVPGEVTPAERVTLRMARLLIQGYCVVSPFLPWIRFHLSGEDSPTVRAMLNGRPHAFQGSNRTCPITVAGRSLDLGPVRLYHPHVVVDEEDARQALAALKAGRAEGHKVTLRPVSGECFRLLRHDAAPQNGWTPMPLELSGFAEPR